MCNISSGGFGWCDSNYTWFTLRSPVTVGQTSEGSKLISGILPLAHYKIKKQFGSVPSAAQCWGQPPSSPSVQRRAVLPSWESWHDKVDKELTKVTSTKVSLDVNSHKVWNFWPRNYRSDYEGHWSKEASKEFKILFIGIVYKATWKAMKKKAFIQLLCLPTFLHLRMRPKVHWFSSAMRRRIRVFTCCGNTSWTKFRSNLWRKQIFVIFSFLQWLPRYA